MDKSQAGFFDIATSWFSSFRLFADTGTLSAEVGKIVR